MTQVTQASTKSTLPSVSRGKRADWEPIGALIDEKHDDSMVLMMCTEALAMHDQWPLVAKNARRLTEEIGTAIGFRLAATALINVGDERRCLQVIEEWASRLSAEDRLPIEFWRLRSAAMTRLGDVSGADGDDSHSIAKERCRRRRRSRYRHALTLRVMYALQCPLLLTWPTRTN